MTELTAEVKLRTLECSSVQFRYLENCTVNSTGYCRSTRLWRKYLLFRRSKRRIGSAGRRLCQSQTQPLIF